MTPTLKRRRKLLQRTSLSVRTWSESVFTPCAQGRHRMRGAVEWGTEVVSLWRRSARTPR